MDGSVRTKKVSSLLKVALAKILLEDVNDIRVKDVTITQVHVTKDLSLARVYFSSLNRDNLLDVEIGLNKSKNFIRNKIKKNVYLKKIPTFEFIRDTSLDNLDRLDELFKELNIEALDNSSFEEDKD